MRITVVTLFPEMYHDFLSTSIIGRTIQKGLVQVDFVQIRDFAHDKYKHVDDTSFGGGAGQVMKCQPVLDALDSVRTESSYVVMMNPAGRPFKQQIARDLSTKGHLILLCGHYEGMDARIEKHCDDLLSIGDYVLTGGELASMVVMDAVIRLQKGAIADDSTVEESFEGGLLEYPQYTKPEDYEGDKVPEILVSGNHEKIRQYRLQQSLVLTRERRPDLFAKHELSKEEKKLLMKFDRGESL